MLQDLTNKEDETSIIALGFSIKYLENLMLAKCTLPFSTFHPYKGSIQGAYLNGKDYMTLNGNALENLEIFLTSTN